MKIIKFYSPTCGPCRALESILNKAHIPHENINVEENETTVSEYDITGIPTIIVLENGKVIDRFHGIKPLEEIKEWYNKLNENK